MQIKKRKCRPGKYNFSSILGLKASSLPKEFKTISFRGRENLRLSLYSFLKRGDLSELFTVKVKGDSVFLFLNESWLKKPRYDEDKVFLGSVLTDGTVEDLVSFFLFEKAAFRKH